MLIDDDNTKAELSVHIVLGASYSSKINTNMSSRTGKTGEPFGWMIMSPGQEDHSIVYLTQSTTHDYEQLYQVDVLGLADS